MAFLRRCCVAHCHFLAWWLCFFCVYRIPSHRSLQWALPGLLPLAAWWQGRWSNVGTWNITFPGAPPPFGARNQGLLPYINLAVITAPLLNDLVPLAWFKSSWLSLSVDLVTSWAPFPGSVQLKRTWQLHGNPGEIFQGTSWQSAAYLFLSNQPIQLSPQGAWKSPSAVQVRPKEQPFFSLGVFCTPDTSWSSTRRNTEMRQVLSFSSLWQLLTKRLGRVTGLKRHCPSGKQKVLFGKSGQRSTNVKFIRMSERA